jgi:hypothetical protein
MNGKTTPSTDTNADEKTAAQRSIDTRFAVGNQAARRHGLRAGTRRELKRRDQRTSRLFGEYIRYRADESRALGPTQLPLARRYCELEVMARDLFAAWLVSPLNARLHQQYISTTRAQALLGAQLGESAASKLSLKRNLEDLPIYRIAAEAAQARLAERNDE